MYSRYKEFDSPFPYTYLITHMPTGMMYHGGRSLASQKGFTPKQDFGIKYFGSSRHELFTKKKIKQNLEEYKLELRWTFNAEDRMWDYEYLVNRRIMVRKGKVKSGLVNGAAWCNKTGARKIDMTPEVIDKVMSARKKICSCHKISECDGTILISECLKIKAARTATETLCTCYSTPECNGNITISKCRSRIAINSKNKLCTCGKCNGAITIIECSANKLSETMNKLCECGECDGTITRRACISKRTITNKNIYTFINHKNKTFTGTQSAFIEYIGAGGGEVSQLLNSNTKRHVKGWYLEGKKPESFLFYGLIKTLYHPDHEPISGTSPELSTYIAKLNGTSKEYDISPVFKDDHKKMTHFGWYCKEKNPDGLGGRSLASVKNKYWQQKSYQTKQSLECWKRVKEIKQRWEELGLCGSTMLLRNLPDELISTSKRIIKFIKLFKNHDEYGEMLELHQEANFDLLISEAKHEDYSNSLIHRSLDNEICQKYLNGKNTPKLANDYKVSIDVIISVLHRNSIRIRSSSESIIGKTNFKL
ncbi:MAG: hypothetical protein ACI971_000778 [Colwellia sp.]|jgi:hypothetical protein